MIQIAVVILNWNGRHHLEKFLASVVKYFSGNKIINGLIWFNKAVIVILLVQINLG